MINQVSDIYQLCRGTCGLIEAKTNYVLRDVEPEDLER